MVNLRALLAALLVIGSFPGVLAAESVSVSDTKDDSDCVCDLTKDSCDVYCCCDGDCGSIKDDWKDDDPEDNLCLQERLLEYRDLLCANEDFVPTSSTKRGLRKAVDAALQKLLCVSVDNSPASNSFHKEVTTFDETEDRIEDNVEYSDLLVTTQFDLSEGTSYETGYQVPTQRSRSISYDYRWPMPGPDGYGHCSGTNSARFMIAESFDWCTHQEQASVICSRKLNAASMVSSLGVAPLPGSAQFVTVNVVEIRSRSLLTFETKTLTKMPSPTSNQEN